MKLFQNYREPRIPKVLGLGPETASWLTAMRNTVPVAVALALFFHGGTILAQNLLRNSSFQIATNPGFPDYWGGQSGWQPEKHELADEGIPGTKSMKLSNGKGKGKPPSFHSSNYGWSPGTAGTVYTFSVYLKSDPPGLIAVIGGSRIGPKEVTADGSWRRYSITAPLKAERGYGASFLQVGVTLKETVKGTLWMNAPMLVRGDQEEPYRPEPAAKKEEPAAEVAPPPLAESVIGAWDLGKGLSPNPGGRTSEPAASNSPGIGSKSEQKDADGNVVVKDVSGNGNDGRIVGSPAWLDTAWGSALALDGKTYVLVPYGPKLAHKKDEVAFELVLSPASGANAPVLHRGMHFGGFALDLASGRYRGYISHPGIRKDGPNVLPKPQHVVVSFKKPTIAFYLDGELAGQGELNVEMKPEAQKRPLIIGGMDIYSKEKWYHPEPGFRGWIRLVRIYGRSLTPDEVESLYRKCLSRNSG